MQFLLFNIRPKLHHWKWRKLRIAHCSELSQLHQQPVDAVVHPTFIWKLCYKGSAPFRLIPIRLITLYWRKYWNPDPNPIPNPDPIPNHIPNPNPNPIPNPNI